VVKVGGGEGGWWWREFALFNYPNTQ